MTQSAPLLVVIFGLPGTGKTTLARNLSQALQIPHLNTDILRTALGRRDRYTEKDKASIYAALLKRVEDDLQAGQGVVVDGTFSREAYRDSIRGIAERTQANLSWIRTLAAEDTIRRRVQQKRPHSQADFKVYLKLREEFEPPKEEFLEVWTDRQTPEVSLQQMLEFLKR